METSWIYGNHTGLGWGSIEVDISDMKYKTLDFEPEFEIKNDIRKYFKNRKTILSLPNMTIIKYIKTLLRGLILYRKL